jgi:hypothetical protein
MNIQNTHPETFESSLTSEHPQENYSVPKAIFRVKRHYQILEFSKKQKLYKMVTH